jgi:hypothetical protein
MSAAKIEIIWTEYLLYRAKLRGFNKDILEEIIRFSAERYFDTTTRRKVVIGKHGTKLVIIPYDQTNSQLVPVTVHSTSRQQLRFRLKTGRFIREQA